MIDERLEELASLYALDLIEGAERSAFEREIAADAELRKLVDALREASAQLALTVNAPTPSIELRNRVMASVANRAGRAQPPVPVALTSNVVRPSPLLWLGWAAAAVFAIAALWAGQRYSVNRNELAATQTMAEMEKAAAQTIRNQLEAERLIAIRQTDEFKRAQAEVGTLKQNLATERIQTARQLAELQGKNDLANFKISRLASLLGNSPDATAIAIWNPLTQEGVLTVDKLPALASNQDYQLWVIDPQYPAPVDGGVFAVDSATGVGRATFRPRQPVAQVTKFAVTRERKGGAAAAGEGQMILISQ